MLYAIRNKESFGKGNTENRVSAHIFQNSAEQSPVFVEIPVQKASNGSFNLLYIAITLLHGDENKMTWLTSLLEGKLT